METRPVDMISHILTRLMGGRIWKTGRLTRFPLILNLLKDGRIWKTGRLTRFPLILNLLKDEGKPGAARRPPLPPPRR